MIKDLLRKLKIPKFRIGQKVYLKDSSNTYKIIHRNLMKNWIINSGEDYIYEFQYTINPFYHGLLLQSVVWQSALLSRSQFFLRINKKSHD